ncbi:hypothetical protein ACT7C9_15145 [Bacillus cereus]
MAKTYKTERGLKTALKKVLGEESKATENGTMSKRIFNVSCRER